MMRECTLDDRDPLSLYVKKAPMVRTVESKRQSMTKTENVGDQLIDSFHSENTDTSKFDTIITNVSENNLFKRFFKPMRNLFLKL